MRIKIAVSVLVAICSCTVAVSRAAPADEYRHYADIDRADSDEQEIVAITLSSAIYAATHDHAADLRIVDAAGHEVPYQLSRVTESKEVRLQERSAAQVDKLTERDDGGLEIIASLDKDAHSATAVRIRTPLKDFERRVKIEGSPDGMEWHELVSDAMLFDYTRFMDIHNFEIALPPNDDRQYRLTIDKAVDEQTSPLKELTRQFRGDTPTERSERTQLRERPLRIEGLDFTHTVTRPAADKDVERAYDVVDYRVTEDERTKTTTIEVHMRGEPLTRFTLTSSTPSFVRSAAVLVRTRHGKETTWHEIGSATLQSIHFRNLERESLDISFPEQSTDEYRIVIRNEDNPPLQISGVSAAGNEYQVSYIAEPGISYRVYFGSEKARRPQYDTAALMAELRGRYASHVATLGKIVDNKARKRLQLDGGWLLGVAIAVMIVVLGFVLYRAALKVDGLQRDDANDAPVEQS